MKATDAIPDYESNMPQARSDVSALAGGAIVFVGLHLPNWPPARQL